MKDEIKHPLHPSFSLLPLGEGPGMRAWQVRFKELCPANFAHGKFAGHYQFKGAV
jgi:hypothetical protein